MNRRDFFGLRSIGTDTAEVSCERLFSPLPRRTECGRKRPRSCSGPGVEFAKTRRLLFKDSFWLEERTTAAAIKPLLAAHEARGGKIEFRHALLSTSVERHARQKIASVRSTTQNAATEPMPYAAARGHHAGARTAALRTSQPEREHRRDERELTDLDADVEEQQRERHGLRGHADLAQRAREPEAVQQPERERDDPREARGEIRGARARRVRRRTSARACGARAPTRETGC